MRRQPDYNADQLVGEYPPTLQMHPDVRAKFCAAVMRMSPAVAQIVQSHSALALLGGAARQILGNYMAKPHVKDPRAKFFKTLYNSDETGIIASAPSQKRRSIKFVPGYILIRSEDDLHIFTNRMKQYDVIDDCKKIYYVGQDLLMRYRGGTQEYYDLGTKHWHSRAPIRELGRRKVKCDEPAHDGYTKHGVEYPGCVLPCGLVVHAIRKGDCACTYAEHIRLYNHRTGEYADFCYDLMFGTIDDAGIVYQINNESLGCEMYYGHYECDFDFSV